MICGPKLAGEEEHEAEKGWDCAELEGGWGRRRHVLRSWGQREVREKPCHSQSWGPHCEFHSKHHRKPWEARPPPQRGEPSLSLSPPAWTGSPSSCRPNPASVMTITGTYPLRLSRWPVWSLGL